MRWEGVALCVRAYANVAIGEQADKPCLAVGCYHRDASAVVLPHELGGAVPLYEIPVTTAMARKIISCRPGADIREAEALMKQNRVRRLPVTDEKGALVGIVSINDLALEAEREATLKVRAPELPESEVAETLATICEHRGREMTAQAA